MNQVWPRRLAHRGTVQASGLWMEEGLVPAPRARRRALELWEPGTSVYGFSGGLLILWSSPRAVSSLRSLGAPLVKQGPWLCAAPIEEDELRALEAPSGAVILVRAGLAVALPLGEGAALDPASWLQVPDEVIDLRPLSTPPPQVVVPPPPPRLALRHKLGLESQQAAQQRQSLQEALRLAAERQEAPREQPAAPEVPPQAPRAAWWEPAARWLAERVAEASPQPQESRGLVRVRQPQSDSVSLWRRIWRRWRVMLAEERRDDAWRQALGQQQAQFLRETLDLFENGELREAMLRAIPLSSEPSAEASAATGPLSARLSLDISSGAAPSRQSLATPFFEQLREAYDRAWRRLVQEGRVEEAAFILLELLREDEQGLALLEEHGRWEMAAEVAQARSFPPERQAWARLRAGDWAQALALARRYGCFEQIDARLQGWAMEQAEGVEPRDKWRLLWAHTLASGGDFARAVSLAWEIDEGRRLALAWNQRLISMGGRVGGRALARKLLVVSQPHQQETHKHAWGLLRDAPRGDLEARRGFWEGLLALVPAELGRPFLEVAPRVALQDAQRTGARGDVDLWRRLLKACPDALLVADLQGVPSPTPGRRPQGPRVYPAHDAGARAPFDVARGPGGSFLAALGEAGMLLVDDEGRELARFPQAATSLVSCELGTRALALIQRGQLYQVHVVDLEARRCHPWCLLELSAWATRFDGLLWLVAQGDTVLALDTLARVEPPRALWRAPMIGGEAQRLAWSPTSWAVSARRHMDLLDCLCFGWPDMALREQQRRSTDHAPWALLASGALWRLRREEPAQGAACLVLEGDGHQSPWGPITEGVPDNVRRMALWSTLEGCAVVVYTDQGATLWWLEPQSAAPSPPLVLQGARRVVARLDRGSLVVVDDRGRLLALDTRLREALTDIRL